ncbi:MAG: transposase [Phycisphaeraceae bacterium]|nr:transposase [Phycisphaeraceae bacterium]
MRSHLDEMVRSTVEQTLNAMLEVEADQACGAGRYECSPDRLTLERELRATLETKAGSVKPAVPRLRESCRSSR